MIEPGPVATGMRDFWVRAVVGLVFLAAVVFHLTLEDPVRLSRSATSASAAGWSAALCRPSRSRPERASPGR